MTLPLAAHGHAFWSTLTTWDWVQFGVESAIFVWVLWLTIKWTLKPGEDEPDHVKRSILDDDPALELLIATSPSPAAPSPSRHRP